MTKTIPREVIKTVNEFRQATGLEEIDDLPPGIKKNHRCCIFARAFNFECSVGIGSLFDGSAEVRFKEKNKDQAQRLAALLGTEVKESNVNLSGEWPWRVDLPYVFNDVAKAFDAGELPARYYERAELS